MLFDTIITRKAIDKGWSADRKFYVTTEDGQEYLLRISPAEQKNRIAGMFQRMRRAEMLGIPMCQPVEWGECEEGIYFLQSWINGQESAGILSDLTKDAQYAYGLDSGIILKKLHSIPAPENVEPWDLRFGKKIDRKIAMYDACPLKYEGGEAFLRHIEASRHLLTNRPQTYQHGDYHTGNMMIDQDGKLTIIDFKRTTGATLTRNLTGSSGASSCPPPLPAAWWMDILAVKCPWISGICWRCTSVPTP